MTPALQRPGASAHHERRQRTMRVPVAVADARSKKKDHMIQQRAIPIRCIAQLSEILGKQLDVMPLDARAFLHLHRIILMMRERMMPFGHADLRIRPSRLLAPVHERDHSRQVGLVSQ